MRSTSALPDKVCIGQHTYFLNGPSMEEPNQDEIKALGFTTRLVKYKKLLRHGVLYCASIMKATKRDSSVCTFRDPLSNTVKFVKILSSVHTSQAIMLLLPYQVTSILKDAGPPCRESSSIQRH